MNTLQISEQTMGMTNVAAIIFVDHYKKMDTQFAATEKAVEQSEDEGDSGLFIIKHKGKLTVVHDSEASLEQEIPLWRGSKNGLWLENKDDPRCVKFRKKMQPLIDATIQNENKW